MKVNYAPLQNGSGEVIGGLAVIRDITDRKRSEEKLRVSEQQYRLLVENVTDGIGIIQKNRLVFVNTALAAMLGGSPGELIGKAPVELFREPYKTRLESLPEHTQPQIVPPQWQIVEFAVTKNHHELWLEGRHSAILWRNESAILVILRDISERKRREQERKQERKLLRMENGRLRTAMKERYRFGDIVGKSLPMQQVYERILKASASDINMVVYGESGTGKDLVAHTIHQLSARRKKAFIPVNCSGIQESLFEREFFGHRKGTFTGAVRDEPGFFDAAHQGTLFLDEVGELSLAMQAKLLRVLEDTGYTPVGSQTVKHADARIITATNRDLKDLVVQGLMRTDFFYRISVITITVPPLRERPEDIPLLVEFFLKQYEQTDTPRRLPGRIVDALYDYDWPGNVRQLQNTLQRYLTLGQLDFDEIPSETGTKHTDETLSEIVNRSTGKGLRDMTEELEKRIITKTLEQQQGNKSKTAKILHIPRRTLRRKMEKYHIPLT